MGPRNPTFLKGLYGKQPRFLGGQNLNFFMVSGAHGIFYFHTKKGSKNVLISTLISCVNSHFVLEMFNFLSKKTTRGFQKSLVLQNAKLTNHSRVNHPGDSFETRDVKRCWNHANNQGADCVTKTCRPQLGSRCSCIPRTLWWPLFKLERRNVFGGLSFEIRGYWCCWAIILLSIEGIYSKLQFLRTCTAKTGKCLF